MAVLPTRFEGCSYSLIEAQDAGLPVVTNHQGHVAEMLEREPALRPTVVPSLEAGAFADRVRLLLEDRDARPQVAEAGRRYVRRHHDAADDGRPGTTSCCAVAGTGSRAGGRADDPRRPERAACTWR